MPQRNTPENPYKGLVYRVEFPVYKSAQTQGFIIISCLMGDDMTADYVFYRDMTLPGSAEMLEIACRAWTDTNVRKKSTKIKITTFEEDGQHEPMHIKALELYHPPTD
jgi:hypothetical protein